MHVRTHSGVVPTPRTSACGAAKHLLKPPPASWPAHSRSGTAGKGAQGSSLAATMAELKITCVAASQHAKMGTQVRAGGALGASVSVWA